MIIDKDITLKIHFNNAEVYSKASGQEVKHGDMLTLNQLLVPPTVRLAVDCQCDRCPKTFFRRRNDIRHDHIMCSDCQDDRKNNFSYVNCDVCNKEIRRNGALLNQNKHNTCSRTCYSKLRMSVYRGENIYSFKHYKSKSCDNCSKNMNLSKYTSFKKFCNVMCEEEFFIKYPEKINEYSPRTNIEVHVAECLDRLNVKYIEQSTHAEKYRVDFYLPDFNLIIEAYGDYWHGNPRKYAPSSELMTCIAEEKWGQDYSRINAIIKEGHDVLILWEYDIVNDFDFTTNEINKYINKNP